MGRQRPLTLPHREHLVLLFDLALETAMRLRKMFTLDVAQVDIARITGHRDPRMLRRYAALRGSTLASALW